MIASRDWLPLLSIGCDTINLQLAWCMYRHTTIIHMETGSSQIMQIMFSHFMIGDVIEHR